MEFLPETSFFIRIPQLSWATLFIEKALKKKKEERGGSVCVCVSKCCVFACVSMSNILTLNMSDTWIYYPYPTSKLCLHDESTFCNSVNPEKVKKKVSTFYFEDEFNRWKRRIWNITFFLWLFRVSWLSRMNLLN